MKNSVGVGVIGTGFARNVQIPGFLAAGAKIVSVASGSIENARATAKQFGVGHSTMKWQETASHPDVDLVCITTPPRLHKEMALFALEHGKHVLCEKPMAMITAEAEDMTSAAANVPVLALIDHELRFHPGRQMAFEMLRRGDIGQVHHARYVFHATHRGLPSVPWNWWSDVNEGGGALGAIASHIVDSFNWLLGTSISEVFCQLQTHIKHRSTPEGEVRPVTTDDQSHLVLRFGDSELTADATGLIAVSMTDGPGYRNRLEFFGSDGAIAIEHRGEVFINKTSDPDWQEVNVDVAPMIPGVADTGFSRGFMAFAPKIVEALRDDLPAVEHAATFEDGLAVQRVLDAARKSDRSGRIVQIAAGGSERAETTAGA